MTRQSKRTTPTVGSPLGMSAMILRRKVTTITTDLFCAVAIIVVITIGMSFSTDGFVSHAFQPSLLFSSHPLWSSGTCNHNNNRRYMSSSSVQSTTPSETTTTISETSIPASTTSSSTTKSLLLDPAEVQRRVFESDNRPIILFDGVCNLCNGAVNLALDWDPNGKLRFAALQSNVGRALLQANGRDGNDISSIVLVTNDDRRLPGSGSGGGSAYTKSDAVLRIAEELTPFTLLPLRPAAALGRYVVPKFLRDIIYDGVADNRYDLLGKSDQCRFDADGQFEDRFVDDSIASSATTTIGND